MPYPSIFYPLKIDKTEIESCINCVTSEKSKLRAIDEARKIFLKYAHNDRCDCAELKEQTLRYLGLLSSYVAFAKNLNEKGQDEIKKALLK